MKTLIIHPEDPTTTFLSQIYEPLPNKIIIKGGVSKLELRTLIEYNDRIFMFGHGSPYGLLNPDQFPDAGFYIVDESMVAALKDKSASIFIWCHADKFVKRHGLEGLNCAMFISETMEAEYYGFDNIDGDLIDQSNERFVSIVSKYIHKPIEVLYKKLLYEYGLLARANAITRFNLARLYLTRSAINNSPNRVVVNFK